MAQLWCAAGSRACLWFESCACGATRPPAEAPPRCRSQGLPLLCSYLLATDIGIWKSWSSPGQFLTVTVEQAKGLAPPCWAFNSTLEAFVNSSAPAAPPPPPRQPYAALRLWGGSPVPTPGWYSLYTPRAAGEAPAWGSGGAVIFDQGRTSRASLAEIQVWDASRGSSGFLGVAFAPVAPVGGGSNASSGQAAWLPLSASAKPGGVGPPPALDLGSVLVRLEYGVRGTTQYCEPIQTGRLVAEPINSYSNFGFFMSGFHMIALGLADSRWLAAGAPAGARRGACAMAHFPLFSLANGGVQVRPCVRASVRPAERPSVRPVPGALLPLRRAARPSRRLDRARADRRACPQLFAGAGSFLFHSSYTPLGNQLDMAAVYMLIISPARAMLGRCCGRCWGLMSPPARWEMAPAVQSSPLPPGSVRDAAPGPLRRGGDGASGLPRGRGVRSRALDLLQVADRL